MALTTYRIDVEGKAEKGGKGRTLKLGTVRFLPRGMSTAEREQRQLFDVWLPQYAPSAELLGWARGQGFPEADEPKAWARFAARYQKEMTATAERREALKFLRLLSERSDVGIGCYCGNESRCHRSLLKGLIEGAK